MLSDEMREYLFRLSEVQPVTMPEVGWPDEVAQLEADNAAFQDEMAGMKLMEAEGESFAETIVRENEALQKQVEGLREALVLVQEWLNQDAMPWATEQEALDAYEVCLVVNEVLRDACLILRQRVRRE